MRAPRRPGSHRHRDPCATDSLGERARPPAAVDRLEQDAASSAPIAPAASTASGRSVTSHDSGTPGRAPAIRRTASRPSAQARTKRRSLRVRSIGASENAELVQRATQHRVAVAPSLLHVELRTGVGERAASSTNQAQAGARQAPAPRHTLVIHPGPQALSEPPPTSATSGPRSPHGRGPKARPRPRPRRPRRRAAKPASGSAPAPAALPPPSGPGARRRRL